MKNMTTTQINTQTELVTLINPLIPQTPLLKELKCNTKTTYLILDTGVRTKSTSKRFSRYKVEHGQVTIASKEYIKASPMIHQLSSEILFEHATRSFLTDREKQQLLK